MKLSLAVVIVALTLLLLFALSGCSFGAGVKRGAETGEIEGPPEGSDYNPIAYTIGTAIGVIIALGVRGGIRMLRARYGNGVLKQVADVAFPSTGTGTSRRSTVLDAQPTPERLPDPPRSPGA